MWLIFFSTIPKYVLHYSAEVYDFIQCICGDLKKKKNLFLLLVYYWRKLQPDRAVFMIGFSYFKYETNNSVMCFWWWSTLQYLRHHFPWPSPCVQSYKPHSLFRGPIMQNRSSVQAWQSRLKRSTYHHRFPSVSWQD